MAYPYWPNGGRPGGSGSTGVTIPSGFMTLWTTPTAPAGWLICNGASVSIASNSNLYAAIGTTYGSNTPGQFLLPNMSDKVALGVGSNALGATGGATTVTLTSNNIPAHTHTASDFGHGHSTGTHTHDYLAITSRSFTGIGGGTAYEANMETTQETASASITIGSNTTGITIASAGGNQPISIVNPFLCLNYIIKQ